MEAVKSKPKETVLEQFKTPLTSKLTFAHTPDLTKIAF
jgi:hypothetical protein